MEPKKGADLFIQCASNNAYMDSQKLRFCSPVSLIVRIIGSNHGYQESTCQKRGIGSTAKWAAKGYFSFVGQNPTATLADVLRFLVSVRYGADAKGHEEILLNMIEKNEIRGLAHLATLILIAEAGFSENSRENQAIFRGVIIEELESRSVPSDFIHQLSL